jgi:hypothetical protein
MDAHGWSSWAESSYHRGALGRNGQSSVVNGGNRASHPARGVVRSALTSEPPCDKRPRHDLRFTGSVTCVEDAAKLDVVNVYTELRRTMAAKKHDVLTPPSRRPVHVRPPRREDLGRARQPGGRET